jgi:hypothetical protein
MRLLFFARDHAGKYFAFADVIGLTDNALGLHAFDNPGGAIVANLQMALNETG